MDEEEEEGKKKKEMLEKGMTVFALPYIIYIKKNVEEEEGRKK